jgi:uncharacterized protein (DUF58 family)
VSVSGAAIGTLLDALRGVRWPARSRTTSSSTGAHLSSLKGTTAEFTEYRAYRQGDDPRRIDWKLLARSDRAYLRITDERAVHPTLFVLDASRSMAFPDDGPTKWTQACQLAIGLASVALASSDPVGLLVTGTPGASQPLRARRDTLSAMIAALRTVTPAATASVTQAMLHAPDTSRMVVITDCLDDRDGLVRALGARVARGRDVVLLHVVAPQELDPPTSARLAEDPENAAHRTPLVRSTRQRYLDQFTAWRTETAQCVRQTGALYRVVRSDESTATVVRFLARASTGVTQ